MFNKLFIIVSLLFFISCAAVRYEIPDTSSQDLIVKAQTAYLDGNIDYAIALLNNVPSRDELEYINANILLGKLNMKLTDYHTALRHFRRVVRRDQDHAFSYYYIGFLNQKLRKNHTAYRYYKKAIFIDRDLLNPKYNPLVVQNPYTSQLYLYIYQIEEDHLFSPIKEVESFYDEGVIARIP